MVGREAIHTTFVHARFVPSMPVVMFALVVEIGKRDQMQEGQESQESQESQEAREVST
jgi:hypothetical protein